MPAVEIQAKYLLHYFNCPLTISFFRRTSDVSWRKFREISLDWWVHVRQLQLTIQFVFRNCSRWRIQLQERQHYNGRRNLEQDQWPYSLDRQNSCQAQWNNLFLNIVKWKALIFVCRASTIIRKQLRIPTFVLIHVETEGRLNGGPAFQSEREGDSFPGLVRVCSDNKPVPAVSVQCTISCPPQHLTTSNSHQSSYITR